MKNRFSNLLAIVFLSTVVFLLINASNSNGQNLSFNPLDTITLAANPGPSNNGGSANWAIFLDIIAGPRNITVTQMSTANAGGAGVSFSVEVFRRSGTSLGGPVGSGPGSSSAGWTSLGIVPAIQGPTANGVSELFMLPPITIAAGDTAGIALKFSTVGPRYFGTGSPPLSVYSDTNVTLITGEVRSAPFTTTGSWFSSRALVGVIRYVVNTATITSNNSLVLPNNFNLSQNYPNPFNPYTSIEFSIPSRSKVNIDVFDLNGRKVATLVNSELSAGTYNVKWDATEVSSGTYFYRMTAGNFYQTKKMLLIK